MINKYNQPLPAWKRDGEKGIKGSRIFLPSTLKAFSEDFMIAEDFVSIVGGLCNHGSTKGDIDILLKCPEPKSERSPLGMATKFRISRAFAKIGIPEKRLQFLYNEFSGPFTSHVHCYDLVLKLKSSKKLHEMSTLNVISDVVPFRFVIQPKPLHGRFKEQIYSPETVTEVIKSLKKWQEQLPEGIIVEKKFDGVRCQVHKNRKKVIIWTEEKTNVTNKLPSIVEDLQKIDHNFVAEFELELWLKGKHQNRADTAGAIHQKESSLEKSMIINLYDLIWVDDKDIHNLDFKDRITKLKSIIPSTERIKVTKGTMVKSLDALKSEVSKVSKLPGSEGAMVKMANYIYPLKPHTSQMIKIKNEFSINVQVVDVHDVTESKAKNYLTAIRSGNKLVPTGRTYNTNIQASKGDKLKIVFVELSKYIDPETKEVWYNFWSPRVIHKIGIVDSTKIADSLVQKSGGQVQSKIFPTRYKGLLEDKENDYFKEFKKNALLWDTEEFDYSLSNGWIKKSLIPEQLSLGACSEIRNSDNFILKKEMNDKAVICLRDSNNKIKAEKIVCLVEV